MPDRIIKEAIHESEDVNKMTDFQFRLWVNLIAYVDDYGRGDARPAVIKGNCFPLRERLTNADIDAALKALAGIGCIALYEVDGKSYLCFPTWESHQDVRDKKSLFPPPLGAKPTENPKTKTETTPKRFIPPTIEEVRAYCEERKNGVDPELFINHYTTSNWMRGKTKITDWKACVRTWERRNRNGQSKPVSANVAESAAERKAKWGIKYDNE